MPVTSRTTRRALVACAATVISNAATLHADPTTLGVEWEHSIKVDLRDIAVEAKDPHDKSVDIPVYKTDRVAVSTRMFCTTPDYAAPQKGFPLVSMTWDMGGLVRTLEIVTAPLDAKSAGWKKVLDYLQVFHQELDAACKTAPTVDGKLVCKISITDLVAKIEAKLPKSTTTKCYDKTITGKDDESTRNLRDPANAHIMVRASTQSKLEAKAWGKQPHTQVSIGVDVADYLQDISALFGDKGSTGFKAWDHFRNHELKTLEPELSNDEKAFLALYYTELHVLLYYLRHPETDSDRDEALTDAKEIKNEEERQKALRPTTLLKTTPIGDDDAVPLKNEFSLLAKTPLNTIFDHLANGDSAKLSTRLLAKRDASFFCDKAFLVDAASVDACTNLHEAMWRQLSSHVDPLELEKLAGSVLPIDTTINKKLRIVFEMRDKTELVKAREIVRKGTTLEWAKDVDVPTVLSQ
jgi:hypothetical protein